MKPERHVSLILAVLAGLMMPAFLSAEWHPVEGQLMTRWAHQVSPERVWPEYPRPQMTRPKWKNLNGLWSYAIAPREALAPGRYEGEILVPFCIESALSGVKRTVGSDHRLWYRRTFKVPQHWNGQKILLHFGAVDWDATVWIDGTELGQHKGGYDPFTFEITGALGAAGDHELAVSVWDPTDSYTQPRGKQVREPDRIWYTAVTGIWQTVWLEPVPDVSIERLDILPDIDRGSLQVSVATRGNGAGHVVRVVALDGSVKVGERAGAAGQPVDIRIPNPKLWSPKSPYLYNLRVTLERDGSPVDEIGSYFGMRKFSIGKDTHGRMCIQLNNKPVFLLGPLDQGWWPDGLYTAPTDEALRYDIEVMKKLGFNMARKHVKVEPARWYYHCDQLGLLVWQDMPNGNLQPGKPNSLRVRHSDQDANRDPESASQFETELQALIQNRSHFPSIITWVVFNEGWGQYDTARLAAQVKQWDPSRLVNATSGWADRGVGDLLDVHIYPGPGMEDPEPDRPAVLGEFGGLAWPVPGHLWWNKRIWGYLTAHDREDLNRRYAEVVGNLRGPRAFGLSAAVYTQITDVEGEVNGVTTYDRKVIKLDEVRARRLHESLYTPPPQVRLLTPASASSQPWRYTFNPPAPRWTTSGFNDAEWQQGPAPFHGADDPFFAGGTPWNTDEIWARRTFRLANVPETLWVKVAHGVSHGTLYLNGEVLLKLDGARDTAGRFRHLERSNLVQLLQSGENVLAIYGERKEGRRGIDVGLYALEKQRP